MTIYNIPNKLDLKDYPNWHLDSVNLSKFSKISDYTTSVRQIGEGAQYLQNLAVEDILNFFDSFSAYLLTSRSYLLELLSNIGIGFIINFLKKTNLESILKVSLNGNIHFLDSFIEVPGLEKKIIAYPRGVITHWLAGNVPVLGMISLIQGIISKNANVVKLSRENGLVLPAISGEIAKFKIDLGKKTIKGEDILNSCLFVYCEKDDTDAQKMLSVNSDVRVAWGGKEAVENVMSLPRKYGTDDVVFGPKYSFALIGRNSYNHEELDSLAYRLAMDASFFEQQGCNSPHTVFVEKGGAVSPQGFAKALAGAMDNVLKRIPKNPVSADEAYTVVNIRSEYSFMGQVFSSKGTEWTVIFSEEKGLAKACYSRTLFVRPIEDKSECIEYIEHKKHQTLGMCINESEKISFAKEATKKGIERVTEIGKMSSYDYPWDGMFPINRFVRWASLQ